MAQIGKTIGSGRMDDYSSATVVAEEVGVTSTTLKRWLREEKVQDVIWGRDARGWIYIEKGSIQKLNQFKNRIHIKSKSK